ncbi:MAG: patatin, partial [Chlorobiaceae bacterium]|nr:patatin [Chlorobiaceae bacterium]
GKKNIEDAEIPLAMIATDIGTGKRVLFEKGDVASAVMASSCIPGVFMPVNYQGMMLVDGMLVENVPVTPLRRMGAEKVIGVDLLGHHVFKKPDNIIGVLLNAFYSTITNTTAMQLKEADLALVFDFSEFSLIDTGQIADIMKAGYHTARPALEAWQALSGREGK